MRGLVKITVLLSTLGLLACNSPSEIGEECEDSGSKDECVDGGICTKESDGTFCRVLCSEKVDCAATESCSGVSGSNLKSCQPE